MVGSITDLSHHAFTDRHFCSWAGWSLFDKIHLMRVSDKSTQDGPHPSLGELLIKKAKEGVRVCLLIWDDKTSLNNPFLTFGMMATHDEDTRRYFNGSKVFAPC
jgi:phospholipase D1/2